MIRLKKEYISNLDNSIKEANENFNSKFQEIEKEISEAEKFFLGNEELKDVIDLGNKIVESDIDEYEHFLDETYGNANSHRLGFEIMWRSGNKRYIPGLTKKGGGFCGEWEINIDRSGKISYVDELEDPKTLSALIKKRDYVLGLEKEYENLIKKINDFLEKIPKGCFITKKKEETEECAKDNYNRDDYTIYLAPKKPNKVRFSNDWQTDELCRRYCDIEEIFKKFDVKSSSELISKLKNEELFREIVEFFLAEGNLELLFRQANLGINYKNYKENLLVESPRLENPIGERTYNNLQKYLKEIGKVVQE